MRRWLSWLALATVVAVALVIGTVDRDETRTDSERARDLAASVRCPTCAGQSALESQAATARGIRNEIERRVADGQSDGDIRAYLVSRYGDGVLLDPPGSGVAGLVWVLPVVAAILAAAGLVVAFRRWRARPEGTLRDEDRVLVERARSGGVPS